MLQLKFLYHRFKLFELINRQIHANENNTSAKTKFEARRGNLYIFSFQLLYVIKHKWEGMILLVPDSIQNLTLPETKTDHQ